MPAFHPLWHFDWTTCDGQVQFPSLNCYNLWAWCRKQFASVTCPAVRTWPMRQNRSSEIGQSSFYLVPNHEEGHIPMSQVIEQHKLCLSKSLDQRTHHSRNMNEHCQHSLAASWPVYQDAAQLQKKTNTYWNTVSAPSNEEDFYFSKSLLIDANLIYLKKQLHTTISTLHPTSWTVKHSRPLCRQNTLIRDENDHIKVSNTQILQVGPRQTDGEGSPAFCQNLALTFSPALKMVPSFNVQIVEFYCQSNWWNFHTSLKLTPKTDRVSLQGSLQCQLLANP